MSYLLHASEVPHAPLRNVSRIQSRAVPDVPYGERAMRLTAHRIALWDVCKAAIRAGSLDASIEAESIITNDFRSFFRSHPALEVVCTNGGTAPRLFQQRVLPRLPAAARSIRVEPLPSTSPAHAALRFEQKLAHWRAVLGPVLEQT